MHPSVHSSTVLWSYELFKSYISRYMSWSGIAGSYGRSVFCVLGFFFFWEISILFSTAAVPVYTPSLLWENLSSTIIFQLVGCPPGGYEMSLYCESILHTILLCLLFLVFECRISLLVGSSLSCHRLFSSYLWFWCLCERRWAQVFLLCCVVSLPGK